MRGARLGGSFAGSTPTTTMSLALATALSAAFGCSSGGSPPVALALSPATAHNDAPFSIEVIGRDLRPEVAISASSGAASDQASSFEGAFIPVGGGRSYPLSHFSFPSRTKLTAMAPAGLPAGTYDLLIIDGRGRRIALASAFTSLGGDLDPPDVTLLSPSGPDLFSDELITFRFTVTDATGPVTLNLNDELDVPLRCGSFPCAFERWTPPVPQGQPSVGYAITAFVQDSLGNASSQRFPFLVIQRPHIDALTPREGPATGGTSLVLSGAWFPADSQILVDGKPLVPGGGERSPDGTLIRGWTSPHTPGTAQLQLTSVAGTVDLPSYRFNSTPLLREVVPRSLPTTDCHEARLVGANLPADGTWFLGRAGGDRWPLTLTGLDATGSVATFCFDPSMGTGPLSLFLESASAGEAQLDGGFAFELNPNLIDRPVGCRCPTAAP